MRISKHFMRSEFRCKGERCTAAGNCGYDTVDTQLIEILEDLRQHFNQPIVINSGCRCQAHNRDEGGAITSQHLFGRAADIVVRDTHPNDVYNYLHMKYPGKYGFGLYSAWVHVDSRTDGPARWG